MRGRSVNQALRYALVVGGAIVSILLFLLAAASDNSGFFDRYYTWLLGVNAGMAVLLLILVIVALARLYSRYKAGKFGSRLVARRCARWPRPACCTTSGRCASRPTCSTSRGSSRRRSAN